VWFDQKQQGVEAPEASSAVEWGALFSVGGRVWGCAPP